MKINLYFNEIFSLLQNQMAPSQILGYSSNCMLRKSEKNQNQVNQLENRNEFVDILTEDFE